MHRLHRSLVLVLALAVLGASACGDSDEATSDPDATVGGEGETVRLLTHDSFALSEDVVATFEAETGLTLEILQPGDAVEIVNRAVLTAGTPEADVLFGIDNNTLGRAFAADLFEPHEAAGIGAVPPSLRLDPEDRVTPIDLGDVCVNYDKEVFGEDGPPPATLDDLIDPVYAGQLVVEDPTTSTPGLAFLLATIDRFGEDGWQDYWRALRANDVAVASGWTEAYYGEFSGGSGEGDRPLVVSYASSPPVEVLFAAEPTDVAPTGVALDTCYRQIEFAGVLRGAANPAGARALIDFMLSETYQADLPLQQYVFPAVVSTPLPAVFVQHAEVADDPSILPVEIVDANVADWLAAWTDVMAR